MPTIGLFSGRKIKDLSRKKQRLTRSQTAIQARDNILRKYGKIIDSRRYYYGGSNNWILYSKVKDAQRTGNVTTDKKVWAKRPHKYDYEGLDTKGGYSSRGPYFGKDLSKGKFSPKINTKRNVLVILKKLYPKTQFIVLGEWGYKNVGVIWTGGPTVKALENLDMARGLSKKRNWVLGIEVVFRRESKKDFLGSLDSFVRNRDRKASSKASTTLPLSAVKQMGSLKKKPVERVKTPSLGKYKIGKTWDSAGYKRKIVGYHGNDSYVVSDNKNGEFRKFGQIVKFNDMDSEMKFCPAEESENEVIKGLKEDVKEGLSK